MSKIVRTGSSRERRNKINELVLNTHDTFICMHAIVSGSSSIFRAGLMKMKTSRSNEDEDSALGSHMFVSLSEELLRNRFDECERE